MCVKGTSSIVIVSVLPGSFQKSPPLSNPLDMVVGVVKILKVQVVSVHIHTVPAVHTYYNITFIACIFCDSKTARVFSNFW